MELSIIIVSWNTCDLLVQCLASINDELSTLPSLKAEILVVDNASTDGTVEVIHKQFQKVCVIENKENVGFAHANNQAIRKSQGKYVLLLNPDTEVKPGAFKILLDFLNAQQQVGFVGARLLNADGSLQTSCYPAPTLSRELWRLFHFDKIYPFGIYQMTNWNLTQPRPVEALLGACILARREVLDEVGLLDENYFMYSEEIDLCYRVQKAGWLIYWVPEAQIVHFGGQSTSQVATEMFLHLYRSKLYYFYKHHGRLSALAYKLIIFFATLIRLILTPLALFEKPEKRRQHLLLAGNYSRLILALPGM